MANKNIHQLTELAEAPAVGDEIALWDADAAATKRITYANLISGENFWQRAATTISPQTDNDSVSIGSGSFIGAAFDTGVAAAGVTLAGTTLAADGTDLIIDIYITPKGTGNVVIGAFDLDITGSIGATGSRVTKGWFTDLECTNAISIGGTAISATYATIATPSFTGGTMSFVKEVAMTASVARSTTAATAGAALTISAAGATSGSTDTNGGNLTLSGGISTGSGSSSVIIQAAEAGASATTDRAPETIITVSGTGVTSAAGKILSFDPNADTTHILGCAKIGYNANDADVACFAHYDLMAATTYALMHTSAGLTVLNGNSVSIRDTNDPILNITSGGIDLVAGVQTIGVTGTRRSMSTAPLFNMWATSALDTGNLRAAEINTFYTGTSSAESIEAFASIVTANVATGNWVNAIVGKIDYSTNGSVTGLAGAICAEIDMPGSSPATGHYACYEAELNFPASSGAGVATSFMIANAWGANVAAYQASGYIFEFTGLGTPTAGKVIDECTAAAASHALRILIDGTPYYILLQSNVDA